MKFRMKEYDHEFTIYMDAETVAEAALLTRFHLKRTKAMNVRTTAFSDGTFQTTIDMGKTDKASGGIPSRIVDSRK